MQSKVLSCGVGECAYNRHKECHAASVEVGSSHAMCDTFTKIGAAEASAMPEVAGCSISGCQFNDNVMCQAPGITVWSHEEHADCATFLPTN